MKHRAWAATPNDNSLVIVDTSVWVDYFGGQENGHTRWLMESLTSVRLGLTDLILCEVLQGIREESVFVGVKHDLGFFRDVQLGRVGNRVGISHELPVFAPTRSHRSQDD